jgi:hypothetical protein
MCRCKGEEGPRTASSVAELGQQEGRAGAAARGKCGGARTSLPARGASGDVSDSATATLDKAHLDSAATQRL